MSLLLASWRAHPRRTLLMLISLLLAGVAEGIGMGTLLPMVSVALGETSDSALSQAVVEALGVVGLEPTLGIMLSVIVIGMSISSALLLLANRQVGYAVAHMATDIRLDLLRALLNSRWQYYLRQPTGALANSIATEAYRASTGYEYAANVLALLIQAAVYAGIALLVSWQASLVMLVFGGLLLLTLQLLIRSSRRAGRKQTRLMRSLLSYLTDALNSVKPLKAMARQDITDSLLRSQNDNLNRAMQKEILSREALRALQGPMLAILASGGLYVALVVWQLPLASVMVLTLLLVRVLNRLHKAQQRYHRMAAQESAYWAIRAVISEAEAEAEPETGKTMPTLSREIRFSHVNFEYGEKSVLRDINLHLPAGSFTSLTGASGAGKTTFLDLLSALLLPSSGQVLIDGVPMEDLDRYRWRRQIGYVPQETLLLHDTLLANVTLGDASLTQDDARRALKQAGAWDFVESLPEGIDTRVGEHGGRLSGGQRQRIVIARALAHRPRLLILDEATSALDPQSEADIAKTLKSLTPGLTIIAVSHRPALIDIADRIYRIDDGRIHEDRSGLVSVRG